MNLPHHPDPDCEALADVLGPDPAAAGAAPPPPPTRFARAFHAADGLFTRLDSVLERFTPRELSLPAQLGPAANFALLVAVASGVLLLVWYSPSVQFAWHSLADLGPRSPGGLTRSLHRYSSDLAMLLILAHAVRTFVARLFADARWLAWVSGLVLLGLVWFIGWTGYWLVWDVRAQLVAVDSMRFLDVLPVFGEPLARLYLSDRTVPSLLFFVVFFLHMLLPLAIAAGLGLHLARLSRARLLPDKRLMLWLGAALLAASLALPAANAGPAQMAVKPAAFTMDWWFLWPLALTSRLSGGGLWLTVGLGLLGLGAVPWWLARRRPRPVFQAAVNVSRCFSCTLCSHDCPFGAITMVPRTDGKPFPSQAQIDPARCIGCGVCAGACDTQGIGLAWFDAQHVTKKLETLVVGEVAQGRAPALALICAQGDGDWELFDEAAWRRRLPGWHLQPIPCAGWVEPKLVERMISKGAAGVLIVGCGSAEAFCREGNVWLPARLEGKREPEFRPNRADPLRVGHVDFDPLRPHLLAAAAARVLERRTAPAAPARRTFWPWGLAVAALAVALCLPLSNAPFSHPSAHTPEFVLSFRAVGDWLDSAAAPALADDQRPVHMRAQLPAQRTRSPVVITLEIDGRAARRVVQPKGVKSDGASVGEWRLPLAPGPHRIAVSIARHEAADAPRQTWTGEITARERHVIVLAFDAIHGFVLEP